MLQACQHHAGTLLLGKHKVADFYNAGYGQFGAAKELQAHRAAELWHAVHHPARAGNQAVTALFLHARQAAQELVGHVFAQAHFTEFLTRNV